MAEFNGVPDGTGRRYAVLASRFNNHITTALADGAMDALVRHGCAAEDIGFERRDNALVLPTSFSAARKRWSSLCCSPRRSAASRMAPT